MADKIIKHNALAPGDLPLKFKDVSGDGTSYAQYMALEPGSISVGGVSTGLTDVQLRAVPVPVSGTVNVGNFPATQPVSGTFFQATQPVSIAATLAVSGPLTDTQLRASAVPVSGTFFQATQPVSISAALAVTGTFFQATQPVSLATNTPDVTDRAARLLGHVTVDNASLAVTGAFFQATQPVSAAALPLPAGAATSASQSTLKAASTVAAATDTASVVQHSPQRADAANLGITATAATGVAATLTIPAAGAGLFHYISLIEIQLYATAARTGGAAPVLVTTTNLPGSPVWDFDTAQADGNTIRQITQPATPIKSSAANTATTIVAPIATTGIWRITAYYYAAP